MFKYLKTFEKFTDDKNDSTELVSAKGFYNKSEDDIKEFNSKKNNLQNIYLQSKTDDEINDKLKSQKFINDKGQFTNEILSMWAQICKKSREIKSQETQSEDIKKSISDLKTAMNDKRKLLTENPDSKDEVDKFISDSNITLTDSNTSLQNCAKKVAELQKGIVDLQKDVGLKLNSYKQNLDIYKKEIDKSNNT